MRNELLGEIDMKKFISLLLIFGFILSVGACSNNSVPEPEEAFTEENIIQTEITTTTKPVTQTTTEATTEPEIQLSSQCMYVLCTGYDEGVCYELVANRIDYFPESIFQVGVIKNNEWLVPLSEESPFLDDGHWRGYWNEKSTDKFQYMSNGCFYYEKDRYEEIIYKPETGVSFVVSGLKSFALHTDGNGNVDYSKLVNDECEVLTRKGRDDNYAFTCFNMNSGETQVIEQYNPGNSGERIGRLSDGLFYAYAFNSITGSGYEGFFDMEGNMVLDLKDYSISDYNDYIFKNGKYTAICLNDSGVKYEITFDTQGNIVKQEKVD